MKYLCRGCGLEKPDSEVLTKFVTYGQERYRFHLCRECKRLARMSYRHKKKEKALD